MLYFQVHIVLHLSKCVALTDCRGMSDKSPHQGQLAAASLLLLGALSVCLQSLLQMMMMALKICQLQIH